jgi:ribosomal protein L11 methylase PrmA
MPSDSVQIAASFRDPSGFLFRRDGTLYRQINQQYQDNYRQLMESGLYEALTKTRLLIPHTEVDVEAADPALAYKIIRPEPVPFISYPYEWSFSQLKDAALTTLAIHKKAFDKGMALKDASAYNIQFYNGRATLIDTLSFETYREGEPWVAYRQFCQHFLAPLALMAHTDVRLSQLMRVYIDGVPLDLASSLLPRRTKLPTSFSLWSHIHIHARAQQRYADTAVDKNAPRRQMSRTQFMGIIESLEAGIRKLTWEPVGTEWADYYSATNYSDAASQHKAKLIEGYLDECRPQSVWDLGANTGLYSRIASQRHIATVAFDIDVGAVERNYLTVKKQKESHILPLVMDLTNPSTGLGWHHQERDSLLNRGPADVVLALALIHHLAIANNVPLDRLARFFAEAGKWLIMEFVPKSDSQVKRLLATREDIFPNYTLSGFEQAFSAYFTIEGKEPIQESERVLYLLKRKANSEK